MENVYIYTLTDPRKPDAVRYVGVTVNPKRRLREHITKTSKQTYRSGYWLNGLLAAGFQPVMQVIEEAAFASWPEREVFWIQWYREQGADLTNSCQGGQGVRNPTEEVRAKSRAAAIRQMAALRAAIGEEAFSARLREIGRKTHQNPANSALFSVLMRKRKENPEFEAKRRAALLRPDVRAKLRLAAQSMMATIGQTPEYRAKMAAAITASWNNPEIREKRLAAHLIATQTPEFREKNSKSHKGLKRSQESIARYRAAAQARAQKPEWLAKLSVLYKARLQDPAYMENIKGKLREYYSTDERRAELSKNSKAYQATLTPEERAKISSKGGQASTAKMTPEQRKERSNLMLAARARKKAERLAGQANAG